MDVTRELERQTGVPQEVWTRVVTETTRDYREGLNGQLPAAGTPTSLSEAWRRYGVRLSTLSGWVHAGKIRILQPAKAPGQPVEVDQRDVALAVDLYRRQPGRGYRPLAKFEPAR